MTLEQMAEELRAAGWVETPGGNWRHNDGEFVRVLVTAAAWKCMTGMRLDSARRRETTTTRTGREETT